jgi:hypothetical protein
MGVLVLDAGNSIIKAKTANVETAFPHAIQPLTEGHVILYDNAGNVFALSVHQTNITCIPPVSVSDSISGCEP